MPKTKSKRGHLHKPTPETRAQVAALFTYGIPQAEIALYIGVDAKTLRKHYRDELDKARIVANMKVGKFLHRAASGDALQANVGATHADCLRAAMFWAKTQMGFREKSEIVGKDGQDLFASFGEALASIHNGEEVDEDEGDD